MTEFTIKLLAAFAFGMACASGASRLLRLLPLPPAMTGLLGYIIALPPAAIALAMYYSGNPAPDLPAGAVPDGRIGLLLPFLLGIASGPVASFLLGLVRGSLHKVAGMETDQSDDD